MTDRGRWIRVIVCAAAVAATCSCREEKPAFTVGSRGPDGSGPVLRLANAAAEKDLLGLLKGRREAQADLKAIENLRAEKRHELEALSEALKERFDMRPDRNYIYEPNTRSLYEQPADGKAGEAARAKSPKPSRVLETPQESAQLGMMLGRKRLIMDMQAMFELLVREKQEEIRRIDQQLVARYSLSPSAAYRYESATKSLYEVPLNGETR